MVVLSCFPFPPSFLPPKSDKEDMGCGASKSVSVAAEQAPTVPKLKHSPSLDSGISEEEEEVSGSQRQPVAQAPVQHAESHGSLPALPPSAAVVATANLEEQPSPPRGSLNGTDAPPQLHAIMGANASREEELSPPGGSQDGVSKDTQQHVSFDIAWDDPHTAVRLPSRKKLPRLERLAVTRPQTAKAGVERNLRSHLERRQEELEKRKEALRRKQARRDKVRAEARAARAAALAMERDVKEWAESQQGIESEFVCEDANSVADVLDSQEGSVDSW